MPKISELEKIPEIVEKLSDLSYMQLLLTSIMIIVFIAIPVFIFFQQQFIKSYFLKIDDANKSMLRLSEMVDTDLRNRRIIVYQDLWELSGLLPSWPHRDVTYGELNKLGEDLRDWYFARVGSSSPNHLWQDTVLCRMP